MRWVEAVGVVGAVVDVEAVVNVSMVNSVIQYHGSIIVIIEQLSVKQSTYTYTSTSGTTTTTAAAASIITTTRQG